MSFKVGASPTHPPAFKVENRDLTNAEAIKICQEKYPDEFKRKKIFTLAIAISAIVLLLIPAIAVGLAALSACTFEIGLLIVAPIAIIGVSILIKVIDDKTLFWSGKLAQIIIKKKEEEAITNAKSKTIEVKKK